MADASQLTLLAGAGVLAGAVNAVAGGGSLIAFPVLVATGLSPLTANITNTIAQLPGYLSIVEGYRPDLVGQGPRLRTLAVPTVLGAFLGVALLIWGGESTFEVVVPWLVLLACLLLALGPRIRAGDGGARRRRRDAHLPRPAAGGVRRRASTRRTSGRPPACCCWRCWRSGSRTASSASTRSIGR